MAEEDPELADLIKSVDEAEEEVDGSIVIINYK